MLIFTTFVGGIWLGAYLAALEERDPKNPFTFVAATLLIVSTVFVGAYLIAEGIRAVLNG